MQLVPLLAVPSQTFDIVLGVQSCTLNVYQNGYGVFMDVLVSGEVLVQGVLCIDRTQIIRYAYVGFIGDLAFFDSQGTEDPQYTGFGTRWYLSYLAASDLASDL